MPYNYRSLVGNTNTMGFESEPNFISCAIEPPDHERFSGNLDKILIDAMLVNLKIKKQTMEWQLFILDAS